MKSFQTITVVKGEGFMCICEKCACSRDHACSYYESYVKSNIAAAAEYNADSLAGNMIPILRLLPKPMKN